MRARRDAALRLLKTMLVASVVIPVTIFAYASWINYQNAVARADEELATSLNILSQQASGIFQSVDLTFTAVDAILGDLPMNRSRRRAKRFTSSWASWKNR